MSTQNWNCQYASQCRSKGCFRNHPNRAKCRSGGGCTNPICRFNHEDGPLCVLSQEPSGCTNLQCNFRHPLSSLPSSSPTNIQQFNKNQRTDRKNSANKNKKQKPKIPQHERVRQEYIAEHRSLIEKINREIIEIITSDEFDSKDVTYTGTVTAKREQILELEGQLNTFQTVWNRAIDKNVTLTEAERKYQLQRELYRFKGRLPAFAKRTEIDEIITNFSSTNRFLIVEGETGSGKSTQLPQYVADHPRMMGKKVICTQPRKLAATSLAARVAEEYAAGNKRGATASFNVGYVIGGGRKKSKRISYMTEGKMLELLMAPNSDFSKIGAIIIDEAHERSIICDILLGSFIQSNPKWDNILLIVSSATLDIAAFKNFFSQNVSHVKIPGRMFPVEKIYQSIPYDAILWKAVAECALHIHKSSSKVVPTDSKSILGDILCFLPGKEDVLKAAEYIKKYLASNAPSSSILVKVFTLYGMQEQEEQKEIFIKLANPSAERKIIFATDIAETSITIDGVVYVVDSGEKKEMTYDPHKNISALKQIRISKSSSKQREGRAGRTRPGTCYKLYSQEDYEALEVNTLPEIFRKPLPLAVLYLREMGIDPLQFNWISRPAGSAIKSAEEELRILGALNSNDASTELGKLISTAQQDPKVVRMIHSGIQKGLGLTAIEIVSILTVANMFFWNGGGKSSKTGKLSDLDVSKMNEIRKSLSSRDGDIATMFNLYSQYKAIKSGKTFVETDGDNENDLNHDEDVQNGFDLDDDDMNGNETNENQIGITFEDLPRHQINSITTTSTTPDDVLDEVKSESSISITDNDDEDNQSKSPPPPPVVSESSTNPKTKVNFQRIRKWCRSQFINYKALTLIDSSCRELLNIFKCTKIWKSSHSNQDRTPNSEEVLKLFLAGFFLHAARKINVKGRGQNGINYFSIQSEVTGCLSFKSAIAVNAVSAPDWILYDKILRLKSTLFPSASKIQVSWIRDECPEFYNQCLQKENQIPTELLELKSSAACIQRVMGKRFVNLERLEDEYNCLLIVDSSRGSIKALCTRSSAERIKARLESDLEKVKNSFLTELSEEIYMRNTRIVFGAGYEIKSLLIKNEYATIYLRNLSPDVCQKAVERLVYSKISSPSKIASILVIQQQERNFAIIKCYAPADAQSLKFNLDGELLYGEMIEAVPHRSSDRNIQSSQNIHQAENTKLKLSWPLAPATGRAKIICSSAIEANRLLERLSFYLPISKVTPIGDDINKVSFSILKPANNKSKVFKDIITRKFKFVETPLVENSIQNDEMVYVVQVVGLPLSVDEIEVSRKIQFNLDFTPIRVKIERKKDKETTTSSRYRRANKNFHLSEDSLQKVQHIPSDIRTHPDLITTEFIDSICNRAGIIFHHPDSDAIEKIYTQSLIEKYISMKVHEQPHRIELDYTITFSVHSDLYLFFKTEFKAAIKSIRKWNVTVTEFGPGTTKTTEKKNKFTCIRLRSEDKKRIIDCRKKLESILRYEIFGNNENRDLMQNLYTFTGRMMMKNEAETETLKKDCYLHWDNSRQRVYIYGKIPDATERVKLRLNQIIKKIEEWKEAEIFETELLLDKKKISKLKSVEHTLENLIKPCNIPHWHMYGSNKIRLSGYSNESLEALKRLMQSEGILFQPKSTHLNQVIDQCGLCYDKVDAQFMITSVCNHAFCMNCIRPMFRAESGTINYFPIICPTCSEKLPICDISKAAPPAAIDTLIQTALSKFKSSEAGSTFDYCPKVGCNQLFRKTDSNQLFYHCDNCTTSFCLACTKQYGKDMEAHEGFSCLEFQRSLTEYDEIPKHSTHIREHILTLRCPKCDQPFVEYDGCAALTCSQAACSIAFCALCLKNCGSDAHPHVMACSKNIARSLFVKEADFKNVHRSNRIKELKNYFISSIQTRTLRVNVFKSVKRDLEYLNIFENDLDGCLTKNVY